MPFGDGTRDELACFSVFFQSCLNRPVLGSSGVRPGKTRGWLVPRAVYSNERRCIHVERNLPDSLPMRCSAVACCRSQEVAQNNRDISAMVPSISDSDNAICLRV